VTETHTCDIFVCVVGFWQRAKHRLRTQNITNNFSQARPTIPEDGSQRIRNMSEFSFVL